MSGRRRALLATAVCASTSSALGQWAPCGAGAGDCYKPHPDGGCIQTACCELVCDYEPLCCEAAWDEVCVEAATELCVGIACPNPGSCLEPHENPGCDDESCCDFACLLDRFCCDVSWDRLCVERTELLCGLGPCAIEVPDDAIPEGEFCYERVNDGCSLTEPAWGSLAAGLTIVGKWTTNGPRDIDSYRLVGPIATVRFRPEFPGQLVLIRGECEGAIEVLAVTTTSPCTEAELPIALQWTGDPTLTLVVSGGTIRGELRRAFACNEIDPENPPSPDDPPPPDPPFERRYLLAAESICAAADLDGDCVVGGADLAILLANWGTDNPLGDLNGSGEIDGADLTLLLANWG